MDQLMEYSTHYNEVVNFTIAERFYNTYTELTYIDTDKLTDDEEKTIDEAINIIYRHLKDEDYSLSEIETDIIGYATLIQEEKGE